jgi:hypothetical protein
MTQKIKSLFVKSVTAFIFCLFLSGCVISPEDEEFGGFPQNVRAALLSSGASSFNGPPEIVDLNLDQDYSNYTSSANTFLLSYTGAGQTDFYNYANYLTGVLGTYYDISKDDYSCYGWINGKVVIELGFSNQWVSTSETGLSIPALPPHTLYLLMIIY